MRIPQEIIDKILANTNIVSVISSELKLTKAGANYKCCCPFHDEKTASMVISPAKGIYKCFGCGAGGGAITFLEKYHNITFLEAVKILADKLKIELPYTELSSAQKKEADTKESIKIANEFAQQHFANNLSNNAEAMLYLTQRGITSETLTLFRAGYAEKNNSLLKSAGNFKDEILISANLIKSGKYGLYDAFTQRIIFPYLNNFGNPVGFTGRTTEQKTDIAKYLNSSDTPLFNKGQVIFGLFQARQEISRLNKVYLVEGQFDVLSFVQSEIKNTIALSGTALTIAQIKAIRQLTSNIVLIFDGDAAGIKAAFKNIQILLAEGLIVKAVNLPEGQDPDSFARSVKPNELKNFLKENEQPFISFMYSILMKDLNDADEKTDAINLIAETIACVDDSLRQANYIIELTEKFNADGEQIKNLVKSFCNEKPRAEPTLLPEGLSGLDEAKELLNSKNHTIRITDDISAFLKDYLTKPTVFFSGTPTKAEIQDLRRSCSLIEYRYRDVAYKGISEPKSFIFLKEMFRNGINLNIVKVEFPIRKKNKKEDIDEAVKETETIESFLDFYVDHCTALLNSIYSDNERKELTERAAEMIAFADATIRSIKMTDYAASLKITKKSLETIVKTYIDSKVAQSKMHSQALHSDEGERVYFDTKTPPRYVAESTELSELYNNFAFFPLLNKNKRPISYVFRNDKGNHERVGNFYITPLLHVKSKESGENKRVVQIDVSHKPFPIFMEWLSKDMLQVGPFRQRLWEESDITFSNGSQRYLDKITDSWVGKFKSCFQIKVYGQQHEGFFAFANAVFHEVDGEYKVTYIDEYGIVEHKDEYYYLPAFSKIFIGERNSSDPFFLYRNFKFEEPKEKIDFTGWAKLMDEVYSVNDNGKWGILYAIMSVFRSEIFPIDRLFTALFFIGPTSSGKSQIALSIRSLFMKLDAPLFNLNSGTDVAMGALLETFRDVIVILEEYNDTIITDKKFQMLKSAVYDGEGRQKMKGADSKEISTTEVNAPAIILGQESPQRDDNALTNRCIICDVPPKLGGWTEHEEDIFKRLKMYEKKGLFNVLFEILKLRPVFRKNFLKVKNECFKELKESVKATIKNSDGLTRILNTVTLFLATCKIMETDSEINNLLKLPFTYQQFLEHACDKVIRQVEMISTTNRAANFFGAIDYLLDRRLILQGKEFKVERPGRITLLKPGKGRLSYELALSPVETQLLHINLNSIYPLYESVEKKEALSKQSLIQYLEGSEFYVGKTGSTRFKWQETLDVPSGDLEDTDGTDNARTSINLKRIVDWKEKNTSSIVLNYDMLVETLHVDYDRRTESENLIKQATTGVINYTEMNQLTDF